VKFKLNTQTHRHTHTAELQDISRYSDTLGILVDARGTIQLTKVLHVDLFYGCVILRCGSNSLTDSFAVTSPDISQLLDFFQRWINSKFSSRA